MLNGILLLAMATAEPTVARVSSASLFKNGYAMVVREVKVKGGSAVIDTLPVPAFGTFWVTSDGTKVREMVVTDEESEAAVPVASFEEYLRANIGKNVDLKTVNLGELSGTLVSVQNSYIILKVDNVPTMLTLGEVRVVKIKDGATTRPQKSSKKVLRVKTDRDGTLYFMGLERGLTWAPGYRVDIDDKDATLVAKSTILNDLANLEGADIRLVTGFPNVPFATLQEPLLSGMSVDQFTGFLNAIGTGGFGGGGRREFMGQSMMMNQAPAADAGAMEAFVAPAGTGEQLEDLFFYKVGGIDLKRGGRSLLMLFEFKTPYTHRYETELMGSGAVDDRYTEMPEGPSDVWHSIAFKNAAAQPLTTGPVSVYKSDQLIGQNTMNYVTAGMETSIRMNKALDVRVEANEAETSRSRIELMVNSTYKRFYDLVTIEGTVEAANRKKDKIELKVSKVVTGEVEPFGDMLPKVTKLAKGLRDLNPTTKIEWTIPLESGKKIEVRYRFKTHIRIN